MKFKLDENLPVELVADFRALGQDAETVADEDLCGSPDEVIVDAARLADRILFTLGRRTVIAFVRGRLPKILEMDLSNRLTVVGASRIRFR